MIGTGYHGPGRAIRPPKMQQVCKLAGVTERASIVVGWTPPASQFFNLLLATRNTLRRAGGYTWIMKLIILSVALMTLVIGAGAARAERWDSKGWVKLGEREVNGRVDHDRIDVGRYEGKFSKLTLYVENSDLELLDFEITLGNNERFHPEVRHIFK